MIYEVLISDEALFDISEAVYWYTLKQHQLENKFLSEVKIGIEYLSKEPYSLQKRYMDVRIFFIKKFPFGIHFIILDNSVKVIAVFNTHQDPKNWISRF